MRLKTLFAPACLLVVAASSPPTVAITEFASYCGRGVALWGKSLCGPILLVDPQTRAAISSRDPHVSGFTEQNGIWTGTLPTSVSIANTSIELGGRRVAEVMLPLPQDPIERRILLSHESFHRIQPSLGFQPHEADNGHLDAKDGRITARLEIAALKAALTSKNWRAPARDALAYRATRLAEFPGTGAAETSLINNEGVAEYTGIKVGAQGHEVAFALQRLDSVVARPSLIRSFGYVVGPAYGLLLDRVSNKWRTAALKGRALPALLADSIGTAHAAADLSKYGGPAIVAEETARDATIQTRRATLTAELIEGPTVTFPFEAMHIDFNPNTLFSLGAAGTVYSAATTVHDNWGILKATGDVLLSPQWAFARVPGPAVGSGNKLSGPGWTAQLAPGYALTTAGPNKQVIKKQ